MHTFGIWHVVQVVSLEPFGVFECCVQYLFQIKWNLFHIFSVCSRGWGHKQCVARTNKSSIICRFGLYCNFIWLQYFCGCWPRVGRVGVQRCRRETPTYFIAFNWKTVCGHGGGGRPNNKLCASKGKNIELNLDENERATSHVIEIFIFSVREHNGLEMEWEARQAMR